MYIRSGLYTLWLANGCAVVQLLSTVWVKKSPRGFLTFSPNGWDFKLIFIHLLYVANYARLQIFIQLSLTFTKRDHPMNFYILLKPQLLSLLNEQMTSLLTSYHIQHFCWHYKSSRSGMTWHRQRSTKLSTTFAKVWTRAFRPMADFLSILCELGSRA